MKLIRNRKMLQAKRRRYSHLMQSFSATIHEGAQEIAKKDAMIEWLAKQLDEYGECSPPDAPCPEDGPYCCPSASPICCAKCWIKAAEKAVQDAEDVWLYDKLSKCPLVPSKELLLEAAEFEGRVAAKLADAYWPPLVYTPVAPFEQIFMPPMDRLKWARIEVEEEMDNELA